MAVASGQLPYCYEWPTPFSVRNHADQGLSGVHLEAAQFVMQSEMRKFNVDVAATQAWRVYTNDVIAGSGYDPKANGDTLNGLVGPKVQIDLDHISLMRDLLVDFLFGDAYDTFSEYSSNQMLEDWIRQAYPKSPSGFCHNESDVYQGQFLRPVFQNNGIEYIPGIFFGDPQEGLFTDADPHWLGGSGIFLDIDVGEVMWNPYPITTTVLNGDTHGTADDWNILAFPFYPMFQRTDGDIITLNGFENKWPEDSVPSSFVSNYAPVGSGKVRFCAYPILGNTEFFFGDMNNILGDPHHIGFSTDKMTVAAISARPLGNAFRNIAGSEVFLNTIPLGTGVYRVACKNSKTNYPCTTVESGIISQWPTLKDITSSTSAAEVNYYGYEVFDNCFWVTDWGLRNNTVVSPTGPSGLSVVSPFTGKILWQRNATNDVAAVVYIKALASFANAYWWDDNTTIPLLSLQRVGTNDIKRLAGRNAPINPGVSFDVSIATYNDTISTVSSQSVNLSLRLNNTVDANTEVETMVFDGTDYWITGTAFNSLTNTLNPFTWQVSSSLTEVKRVFGARGERLGFGNSKLLAYSNGLSITEWTVVVDAGVPEGFSVSTVAIKPIIITGHIGGTLQTSEILTVLDITGMSEFTNGTYALVRIQTNTTGNKLYIFRIEEGLASWTIKGIWVVRSYVAGIDFDPSTLLGMIVMPVN